MKLRSIYNKALRANLFSFLVIGKFAGLVLWGLLGLSDADYFGQYSLCLGLVNVFYVVAGMRGRLYVLRSIHSKSDFMAFSAFMALFGVIGSLIVMAINAQSDIFLLLILVAATKFGDIFLLANASFVQNQQSREMSFDTLNRHGQLVLLVFFIGLPFGLEYAIGAEICVICFTLMRQAMQIRAAQDVSNAKQDGAFAVLQGGVEFTITAGLNAGINTYFIYYVADHFVQADVYLIAKIIAIQAIAVRIITGNSIYFMKEIENRIEAYQGILVKLSIAVWVITTGAMLGFGALMDADSNLWGLLVIGAGFTIINAFHVLIRQRVLLLAGPRAMAILHGAELITLLACTLAFDLTPVAALFIFGSLRLARIIILTQPWFVGKRIA